MNIRTISSLISAPVAIAMVFASTVLVAPAYAAWESVGGCPSSAINGLLKASDNRPLRIMAGFSGDVTVYGHLLDTVRDVGITGILRASATQPRGVSGFQNSGGGVVGRTGPNFCALGSLIVKVSIPRTISGGQRGTLAIGGERIPVEIVVDQFSAAWDARNDSESLTPGTQEQIEADARADNRTRQQSCTVNAEARFQQCVVNRPAVEASRAQRCAELRAQQAANQSAGVNSVRISGAPSPCDPLATCDRTRSFDIGSCNRIEPRLATPRAPRCLRDLGGSSLFLANGTLEITLPPIDRASDAQLQTCLGRGFDIEIAKTRANFDHFLGGGQCGSRIQHRFEVARQTGGVAMQVAQVSFDCNSNAVLTLPANVRQTLIGQARGTVTLRHSVIINGTTNTSIPDMGESSTTLNYTLVPPPSRQLELRAPLSPPKRTF